MVGVRGFEPLASWSRTKRATKLRHTPNLLCSCYIVTALLHPKLQKYTSSRKADIPSPSRATKVCFCKLFREAGTSAEWYATNQILQPVIVINQRCFSSVLDTVVHLHILRLLRHHVKRQGSDQVITLLVFLHSSCTCHTSPRKRYFSVGKKSCQVQSIRRTYHHRFDRTHRYLSHRQAAWKTQLPPIKVKNCRVSLAYCPSVSKKY